MMQASLCISWHHQLRRGLLAPGHMSTGQLQAAWGGQMLLLLRVLDCQFMLHNTLCQCIAHAKQLMTDTAAVRGVYALTESVQRGNGRLPLQKLDQASGDLSGGYILEMSNIVADTYYEAWRSAAGGGTNPIVKLGPSRIDFVYPKVCRVTKCTVDGGWGAWGDSWVYHCCWALKQMQMHAHRMNRQV
jgi:hypothetical protein